MGKHRHSKDRLFITMTEHKNEWGGKKDPTQAPIPRLSFNYCPLSLQPFSDPVCSPDGTVFDIVNIIPFVKRYHKNPVTGAPLKIDELIKLKYYQDEEGNYICPVSKKVFTDSTKIVAIKPSGVVYAASTVEELNRKAKFFCDLMTGKKFLPGDIIVLQDPMDISKRIITNFDYLQNEEEFDQPNEDEEMLPHIEQSALGKRILEKVDQSAKALEKVLKEAAKPPRKIDLEETLTVEEFLEERRERKDWRHELHRTGSMANSVTCTDVDLKTSDEKRPLTDIEMMREVWNEIKSHHHKGFIQINTNLGEINAELFTDQAVRTCYSFLELIYKGKLDGMKFKKLIPGVILNLENSVSRSIKLDTVDRSEKLFHKKPGLLTVDTLGDLNTMGITLGPSEQLDRTNSVFGVIHNNFELIEVIESAGENNFVPLVSWNLI